MKSHRRVMAVLFGGVLMEALDIAMVGPALPAIRTAFGIDDRAAAWVFGVFVLFNLIGTPLMAKLSDRFGRRAVYSADVALFAVGSTLVAAAPTFTALLLGRAIQGLAAGGTFPVASATIGDVFPPERRGRALGLIGAVFGVAFFIGPVIGGILLLWSWRLLFLVSIPIAVWVAAASLRRLPGRRAGERRPFDLVGLGVLTTMLGGLAFAMNRIDAENLAASLQRPDVWPLLALSAALAAVWPAVERRAVDPIVPPRLLRSRQIVIASGLSVGAGLAEAGFIFMPAMLVTALGVSLSRASFMLLPLVIAMGIGAPLGGRLLDRAGARIVALCGTVTLALGATLVASFDAVPARFFAGSLLIGLGLGALLGSVLRYVMLQEAPADHRAAAQGLVTIFISIGQLLGSALLGALIASAQSPLRGYARAFTLIALTALLLATASLALNRRQA